MQTLNKENIWLELFLGTFVCFLLCVLATRTQRVPHGLRLPPGPRGRPIIGNVADMPSHYEWETFRQWAHEYGNLVYINVLGVSIVIVNSLDVAHDLFERKASIYSDRYDFPMLMLMGWDWNWGLMKYGARWRKHRKTFLQNFHLAAVKAFYPVQTKWTRTLLEKFRESPENFATHLRHHSGAIIMDVLYGIQVLPEGDPYLETAEEAMLAVAEAATPGAFLIDLLPILKYVPEWVPGAGFQKKARMWRIPITRTAEAPFRAVKQALGAGTAKSSVTMSLLQKLDRSDSVSLEDEEIIRNTGALAYAAGSDSTNVALTWFILAMVLYPEVQRKAQAELDIVVGTDRLPDFADRDQLPYVNALCKEIQRWNPVAPLGLAHAVSQDDIYGDYFIPGGSIVIGNSWAMLRDEKAFGPRAAEFEPERFLEPGRSDPTVAFGYGRRTCPGRHMASNTIFIAVASILKVFNISHARDSQGDEIPVKAMCTLGTITRPEEFQCSIVPRSAATERLLWGE